MKICDGILIKHVGKGGMSEPKSDIKKRSESFGIDTSIHKFLFLDLVVFGTEASLTLAIAEPAAKQAKMCTDDHGNQVE